MAEPESPKLEEALKEAQAAPRSTAHALHGGSDLEGIINGAKSVWNGITQLPKFFYDVGKQAVGAATVWFTSNIAAYYFGAKALMDSYIMGNAFILGDWIKKKRKKEEMSYGAVIRQGLKGVILGSLLGKYYDYIVHKITSLYWKAASILPLFPPWVHGERLLEYVFGGEKYNVKNANQDLWQATKYIGPFAMLNASIIPRELNLPVAGILTAGLAYLAGGKKKEAQGQPQMPGMPAMQHA